MNNEMLLRFCLVVLTVNILTVSAIQKCWQGKIIGTTTNDMDLNKGAYDDKCKNDEVEVEVNYCKVTKSEDGKSYDFACGDTAEVEYGWKNNKSDIFYCKSESCNNPAGLTIPIDIPAGDDGLSLGAIIGILVGVGAALAGAILFYKYYSKTKVERKGDSEVELGEKAPSLEKETEQLEETEALEKAETLEKTS